jgi:hypothetical protein
MIIINYSVVSSKIFGSKGLFPKIVSKSSLNITSIYLKYANPTGSEQIKIKSTLF